MRSDDGFSDAQAETAAFDSAAVRGIATEEAFENTGAQFGGQSWTGVGDTKGGVSSALMESQGDAAVFVIMLHGIVAQNEQKLAKAHAISDHLDGLARRERDADVLRGGEEREAVTNTRWGVTKIRSIER